MEENNSICQINYNSVSKLNPIVTQGYAVKKKMNLSLIKIAGMYVPARHLAKKKVKNQILHQEQVQECLLFECLKNVRSVHSK
ncbi:hypothetical protein CW304_09295 [Bacillus sp. UFRGS-B20]|nr:hypothetical protein CW304_09295 [Bacillus sp. UFRGS-B20]